MAIDLDCTVTPNSARTIYSYSCTVFPGSGQEDTLVCAVGDVTVEPCEFLCLHCTKFPSVIFLRA